MPKCIIVYYIILLYFYKWYNIFQISIYLKFCLKKINCFQFIITDCEFCLVILLKDPWQTSFGCLRTTDIMLTVSWALLHFIIIFSLLKHSSDRKQDLCVWSSEWSVSLETVTHLLVIFCHDAHILDEAALKAFCLIICLFRKPPEVLSLTAFTPFSTCYKYLQTYLNGSWTFLQIDLYFYMYLLAAMMMQFIFFKKLFYSARLHTRITYDIYIVAVFFNDLSKYPETKMSRFP